MEAFFLDKDEMIVPTLHRVLVKVPKAEEEEKKWGSIILPQTATSPDQYSQCNGVVLDMGPTAFKDFVGQHGDPGIAIGDKVVFPKFAGVPGYDNEGGFYRIMNDEEIYGKKKIRPRQGA